MLTYYVRQDMSLKRIIFPSLISLYPSFTLLNINLPSFFCFLSFSPAVLQISLIFVPFVLYL